ncbi:MAG: BatA domain-containing protein [Planctomycetota bacterium]|nr:BatA domain-containing protein [Planctomycetota bacterium]
MGTYFANPLLLWGGLAIAAPIIIFLLTRFRFRTVEWAALTFLQRAVKRQQRRLNLENLLLLLVRCLILLLFALALARPRAQALVLTREDDVRKNVVIALDASYSMGYQLGSDEDETAFERARRTAKEIVAGLESGDRVMVSVFDEDVRSLYPSPREMNEEGRRDVLQDLDDAPEVRRSERGTDLPGLLAALPRVLSKFDLGPGGQPPPEGAQPLKKTLYLLTDCQRAGVLDDAGGLKNPALGRAAKEIEALGATIVLVDCGAEDPKNLTVTRFGTLEPVVGQDLPCHVEVSVKNWSAFALNDLTVEYFVDGATTPQKVVSLSIPPGEERAPEPLRYLFKEAGPHRVEVQVRSDGLVLDNRRHVVIDVRREVRVLLVDGERGRARVDNETYYLEEALKLAETDDGRGLIRPEVVDPAQVSGARLEDYDVVILANVGTVPDDASTALEAYARQGGAVVFTLGGLVDVRHYNDDLWRGGAGLFPTALQEMRGGTWLEAQDDRDAPAWFMTVTDPRHPVAGLFTSEEMVTWLKAAQIYGFFAADPAPPTRDLPAPQVPFRLVPRASDDGAVGGDRARSIDEGQPLLVERAVGRGRAVAWLTTVDYGWNNCVVHDGFYVPFWRQLVLDLTQRSRPALNLGIGDRYERLLRAEEYGRVEVETPDGRREQVPVEKLDDQELYRALYPPEGERDALEMSGFYTVARAGVSGADEAPAPDYFAVTIDPAEGDLAKFSAEELQTALEVPVRPIRHELVREVLVAQGGGAGASEFWRHALAGVIGLLVLESVLAAAFGRGRR